MEINKQAYDAYVKEVTPVHNKWLSIVKAFLCLLYTSGEYEGDQ